MNRREAARAIESLRKGIPPDGHVRHFTVGRAVEIDRLRERLAQSSDGALLLMANYGSGKSHLLRFNRETALARRFAVSSVTLDARHATRFNRMDQVLGAVWRGLETPGAQNTTGVGPFLDLVCTCVESDKAAPSDDAFWQKLSDNGRWGYSETLDSSAMFVALRAWLRGGPAARERIEDWLRHPWQYQTQRKVLYSELVEDLRIRFRDPRAEWQFYADEVFVFNTQDYHQSWSMLQDMLTLTRASGLAGLVILFDEVEDILTNLTNVAHQEKAFWNIFQFFSGRRFSGMTYHGVTPDFVGKCKRLLMAKERSDYDHSRFDALPAFQMSPLEIHELEELALRIVQAHGVAYNWEPDLNVRTSELQALVVDAASIPIQDRARHTIRAIVHFLDRKLEGAS